MKVLLLSSPVATHFTPMIPLAWALRARGHEVVVVGQPEVTEAARGAGLCTADIGNRYHPLDLLSFPMPPDKRPIHVLGRPTNESFAHSAMVWALHARYHAQRYLDFAKSWGAELVISEQMEFAGPLVAATLGIPFVMHRWGIDPLSAYVGPAAADILAGLAARWGITSYGPAMVLDPCPESLQVDGISPGAPIRAVPFNGTGVMPPWWTSNGTRVCVSLGRQTVALNGAGLVRSVVHGIARLGVEVIVTVGDRVLDDIPGVRVVEPTPLGLFLSSCDVLIHHGGANTTMTAVTTGTPHIVLPQLADQFVAADRIVDAGVGLSIDNATGQDNPSVIGNVVSRVLNEPHFRRAATDLADTSARMPSPSAVVADLEVLVGKDSLSCAS